jgi:hypothetical protein
MKISLRTRILLLVALINVAVFGIGLLFLARDLEAQKKRAVEQYYADLANTLAPAIDAQGDISFAPMLQWPKWKIFADAIVVRGVFDRDEATGEIRAKGAVVNPLGRFRRPQDFDEASVLRSISAAIDARDVLPAGAGFAVPVLDPRGNVWGGCWFSVVPDRGKGELVVRLLRGSRCRRCCSRSARSSSCAGSCSIRSRVSSKARAVSRPAISRRVCRALGAATSSRR